MMCGMLPVAVSAKTGDLMSNPVKAVFDKTYSNSWTKDTDHKNHYVRFTVPERGIVTINATKPFDSDAEYGSLKFDIYD